MLPKRSPTSTTSASCISTIKKNMSRHVILTQISRSEIFLPISYAYGFLFFLLFRSVFVCFELRFCSTLSQHTLFIYGHFCSSTYLVLFWSSLKITSRFFRYAASCLWIELPTDLREPRQIQSPSDSFTTNGSSSSSSPYSPLASSLTRSVFYSELKTWLFGKSFPP